MSHLTEHTTHHRRGTPGGLGKPGVREAISDWGNETYSRTYIYLGSGQRELAAQVEGGFQRETWEVAGGKATC